MTPQNKARLLAAIAAPLLLLHGMPARCQTAAAAPRIVAVTTPMAHVSVTAMGGHGSPVVLIPGLASPRAVWDATAAQLGAGHRVLLVQVNGFAGDDPRGNLAPGLLDGVVADLHSYLARQGITRPAVIGHSMGGLIGLMLARAHPGDVGRLMVVDALPWYGMLFGPTATVAMVEPQARALRDRTVASYGTPMPDAAAEATAAGLALKPTSRALVTGWAKAADPRVTGEALYEDLLTDLRPAMAGIAAPITLVYPVSATRPGASALYHAAYAPAPHVTYVEVPDSAHFVMLDQPEAFARAVAAFIG